MYLENNTVVVDRNIKQDFQNIVQGESNALSGSKQGLGKLFGNTKK